MILQIFFGLLFLIVAGIIAYALAKPSEFKIERSVNINASPDKIHLYINDFHNWSKWSPYDTLDTSMSKNFEGHNTAVFSLTPKSSTTDVTWSMHGPMAFVAKVVSIFINMDKMLGKDFEIGLNNLKKVVES
jgi:hypothetical protein